MPLTEKGEKIKAAMTEQYGPEKGEQVFYASKNKGTISGVDAMENPEPDNPVQNVPEREQPQAGMRSDLHAVGHLAGEAISGIGRGAMEAGEGAAELIDAAEGEHPRAPAGSAQSGQFTAPTLKDYARRAGMRDQPPGVLPTPTPTQSPTPNMPTPAQPTGQIPSPTPMTSPATVNAYGEIPGANVGAGPTNQLVAGDRGRQVGTLRDYARAAGASARR
jgi:hypothetical protein